MVTNLIQQLNKDDEHGGELVVYTWGKYSKLQLAAAPFLAISDALEQLVVDLIKDEHADLLKKLRDKLCNDNTRMALACTFPSVTPVFGSMESDPATTATSMIQ
eukprot:4704111-Ditylum_brightwellii.AAC.1